MRCIVAVSKVADGSMYDRSDPLSASVIKNRTRFLSMHSLSMAQTTRLTVDYDRNDFCRYQEVSTKEQATGMNSASFGVADAVVTRTKDHALFLPVADCIGAVFYDAANHVLALAHLGRHSLEQQGAKKIVAHLEKEYGSTPANLQVWLTPAVSKKNYPIWALGNKGMKEAALEQFEAAGISTKNISNDAAETDTDPDYFSYSAFLNGSKTDDGDHAVVAMMTD